MATLHFQGIDEYAEKLSKMNNKAVGMIKRAVYDGAAAVLHEAIAQISALPVITNRYRATDLPLSGVTATQKAGLLAGIGLAKMTNANGFINTKLGFSGYNGVRNGKYPNGQPNALIARAVNSGTSVRVKIPFVTRTVKAAEGPAITAMAARFDADTQTNMR